MGEKMAIPSHAAKTRMGMRKTNSNTANMKKIGGKK